jgi:hypothetical protein
MMVLIAAGLWSRSPLPREVTRATERRYQNIIIMSHHRFSSIPNRRSFIGRPEWTSRRSSHRGQGRLSQPQHYDVVVNDTTSIHHAAIPCISPFLHEEVFVSLQQYLPIIVVFWLV